MWENCHKVCEKSGQRLFHLRCVLGEGLSSSHCSGILGRRHQVHPVQDLCLLGCVRQHLAGSPANAVLIDELKVRGVSMPYGQKAYILGSLWWGLSGEAIDATLMSLHFIFFTACRIRLPVFEVFCSSPSKSLGSLPDPPSCDSKFLLGVFPELKYDTKNTFNQLINSYVYPPISFYLFLILQVKQENKNNRHWKMNTH